MTRVMIVDDEYYFRQALKVTLPWEELGFEICGEARNGEEALEKLEELKPDIILVDINMPVMNGMEFIREAKSLPGDPKYVILTGHNEFNYAREALQLGAENYILKPVNKEELKKNLLEIKEAISREANIKIEIDALKKRVWESMPLLKGFFLNELVQGNIVLKADKVLEKARYLQMDMGSAFFRVIVVEAGEADPDVWAQDDIQLWMHAIGNIAEEMLTAANRHIFFDSKNRICILIGTDSACEIEAVEKIYADCMKIKSAVNKYLKIEIGIGIGNEYSEISSIPVSYKEAVYASKNKRYSDEGVILYGAVEDNSLNANFYPVDVRSKMLISMRLGDMDEVHGVIDGIFNDFLLKKASPGTLEVTCMELVSTCMEFLAETSQDFRTVLQEPFELMEEIRNSKSLTQIGRRIKEIFSKTIETAQRNKSSKSSKIAEDARKFIELNYSKEDLKIEDICRALFINYAHLCMVFKRETSMTLNEYITGFRMKKAKELFDKGAGLVQDVAFKVGYEDANYFSKCFKKFYGITALKYIEEKSGR